jgi:dienelactone hydrolase
MFLRRFVFGLCGSLALLGTAHAHGLLWLAPAYPGQPMLGPTRATGAVIWSHGRSVGSEDSTAPTPPYMAVLQAGGWDTYRFNRMRVADTLDNSARGLVAEVLRLKREGYRQVALTGQSFGGFLALMAADASNQVDSVVVTAPAAYGSFSEFYGSWRLNATKLYPLYQQVRDARVMAFYFHGDDFDPGGRGDRTRAILDARQLPHVVMDQPPLLTTHWAASTPQFAKLYGNCILGFLDALRVDHGATCNGDSFWAGSGAISPTHPAATAAADGIAGEH